MSFRRLTRRSSWPLRGRLPLLLLLAAGLPFPGASQAALPPHVHPLELAAGDFVRATVAQRADVRVELLDPEGKEIVHVDGPNGIREDEEIAAVAERSGLHQLRVLSCPEGKPAADCYTLRLDPPRPATGADRLRAEAVRTTQAAAEAMFERTEASWRRQLELRGRTLEIWRTLGERRREARELVEIGIVHRLLRELETSGQKLHEAAEIYAALGSAEGEARARNEAGLTCQEAGHTDEAIADYRRALERAGQESEQREDILNNLGLLLGETGEAREGLPYLQQALEIARKRGDQVAQANILSNLGMAYEKVFERQKALDHYQQALALASAAPGIEVAVHNNFGSLQEDLGNWDEALKHYTRALELNEALGDRRSMAATLTNLGYLHIRRGQFEQAQTAFQRALALARETDYLKVQVSASNSLGVLHTKMGKIKEAIGYWHQVESLSAGHPELAHIAGLARASAQIGEGKLDAASATLGEGLKRSREREDRTWEGYYEIALSEVEWKRGNLMSALLHAESGVEIIESLRGRVVDPDLRALFLASNQSYYERQIDILMELSLRQPGKGFDERAVRVSEQARARGLLDLLGEAGANIRQGVDPALLERESQARALVRELDIKRMELEQQGAPAARRDEVDKRLAEAVNLHNRIESEVRARSRAYEALTQPRPLDHVEIQSQVLGQGTLLLEYALGEKHSYLWAITPDALRSFVLPARHAIEKVAREFYGALTERNENPEGASVAAVAASDARAEIAGRELSRMILGPVESLLGDNILLVVPDGVLQYVPFAALPRPSASTSPTGGGERIMARNQVVSLPSASTLAVLRRQIAGRAPAPKMLAVLADPVLPGDPRIGQALKTLSLPKHRGLPPRGPESPASQIQLARLPFSAEEARGILSLVKEPGQTLEALGFDASYASATSGELARYRIVHFATHGLIDSEQPELSKLALSQFDEKGQPRKEAFLPLADIYNLELNADLVVLSACQTALGREVRREGLIGLTRGFMYAGAARVLASLWSVEDRATAKLMKIFYKHLLVNGRSAPDALRRAQLEMAAKPQYSSPYYWAGFSLQGEWK